MRYLKNILILLLLLPLSMTAQIKKKPTKTLIGKVRQVGEENLMVKPGEFKIDFENKIYDENLYKRNNKYFVIVRDDNDDVRYIKMNNHEINLSKSEHPVEVLRAGLTIPDFMYIDRKEKCYLHVAGMVYGPYEEFTDIFPTGYICKNKDMYTFMSFDGVFEEKMPRHISKGLYDNISNSQPMFGTVTFEVPVPCEYDKDYVECDMNGKSLRFKTRNDVLYHKTHKGHYYMLYNDTLMDNSLIIVDGKCHELDSVVMSVDFKFSQDGSHWMAFMPGNLMVDGVTVCRTAQEMKHFAIKNNGEYAYVIDGDGLGDKLYMGDEMFVDGINMMWLAVDDEERFNYIFRSSQGYFYGLDNVINDRKEEMKRYYYPPLSDPGQVFTVTSDDGKHTFVYSYDWQYVLIDGKRLDCPSVPHYAVWDPVEECFMWNAVENLNLYLYTIQMPRF